MPKCAIQTDIITAIKVVSDICPTYDFDPVSTNCGQIVDAMSDYWIDADGDLVCEYTHGDVPMPPNQSLIIDALEDYLIDGDEDLVFEYTN